MAHRLPLADIQFIASFAAFCRSKGDEEYCWANNRRCALAQFGYPGIDGAMPGDEDRMRARGVPVEAFDAALGEWDDDNTFCALADRLEALIADAPAVVQQ